MINFTDLARQCNTVEPACFSRQPFPHWVWDDVLRPEAARAAAAAYPETSAMIQKPEIPRWHSQERTLAGPALQQLCSALLGDELVAFVEKVTGTSGLRTEPNGEWGSYRLMSSGAVHHAHVGSNLHPETGRLRRYSLFTYISEDWRSQDGGWLELGAPESGESRTRILPKFNRSVLLEMTPRSFHGVSAVLAPPPTTRKTVTVHFWSEVDSATSRS